MTSGKMALLFLVLVLLAGCSKGSSTPPPTLVSIAITPANAQAALGTTRQFAATGIFSDNSSQNLTSSVTWSSSAPGVATVSNSPGLNGLMSLVSKGTTTITATSGSMAGSTTLTVIDPALIAINVEPSSSRIVTGATEQFTAVGTYSDGSTRDISSLVTWTSSDPLVVTVNTSGLGTAVSKAATATVMVIASSENVTGSAIVAVTGGSAASSGNVLPISVNGSLCSVSTSASYPNKPCVSVTVCTPGTAMCQTITDILLDTGSFGLRIFKQALSVPLNQVKSGSGSAAECVQFGDNSTEWGPVQTADVILGNEKAQNVPIQVIDSTFGTVPRTCPSPDTDPGAAGLNGILGVGVLVQDCGQVCATYGNNGLYYSCAGSTSGSACVPAAVPLSNQVQNPVALLPAGYNNGVVVELPSLPSAGLPSIDGILVLGIGTQPNNIPSGVTLYAADKYGEIQTGFSGTYPGILDTGSNGLYFTPPSADVLPSCAFPNSTWFCPLYATNFSAINAGTSGSPGGEVLFQIGNFTDLINSSNNVFSNVGGRMPDLFDWGLPFYFGRIMFVGIEGRASSIGTGPYFAY